MDQGRYPLTPVFIDAEYTGEHAHATLVSLGLVGLHGQELHVTLDDYDQDQVTDWLRNNVLAHIDEGESVPSSEAYKRVSSFLEACAGGTRVALVSAGLGADVILLMELYKHAHPDRRYFHALHCLPSYLNHGDHMDLRTLFQVAGIDPSIDRAEFAQVRDVRRHSAIDDARVVRACFLKLMQMPELTRLRKRIVRFPG